MRAFKDYQGRRVRLTAERLRHILDHAEMGGMEREIEETLLHPVKVVRSRTDAAAELSYRYCYGTKVGDKWLCVVVKYLVDDAFVVTAYLTDSVKKGEQLWPTK